jgi:hypothetical protein
MAKVGISRIPISAAALLVNRTVPIPGDPEHYVVSLSVFHQLHCLVGVPRWHVSPFVRTANHYGQRICCASVCGQTRPSHRTMN